MKAPSFVHLFVHSELSLVDGLNRIKTLPKFASADRQPAIALTDLNNLYGVVRFYKSCLDAGIKPIIGCDVWVKYPQNSEKYHRMLLLAQTNQGYRHISELITNAYLKSQARVRIAIDWNELCQKHEGIIAIIDDIDGLLSFSHEQSWFEKGKEALAILCELMPSRVYLGISRIGRQGEEPYIALASQYAANNQLALVATNRAHFATRDDFDAHEIRVCIHEGRVLDDPRRPRNFTEQQYLRSQQEMQTLFSDLPEALENTVEIAKKCNVFLDFTTNYLPDYPDTNGKPVAQVLRQHATQGLCQRLNVKSLYGEQGESQVKQEYIQRLDFELNTIGEMGFPGYFLIVADFINWSRNNDIPVGPGRGSGAGSLIAWALGITELDPLAHGLLFERFLNPERVSLPDFDIDFCVDGRDRVIEYVAQRYGSEQVAQIITFGTMAAKAVVRDVGRVKGFAYGFVDQVAKLIPNEIGITLQKAIDQEEALRERYENEEEIREFLDMAQRLEGLARNVGKHAGGVVISPRPLTEFTPLYFDSHLAQPVTQLDKDDLEAVGLVKFDFLGLRTLTIINGAVKLANQQRQAEGLPPLDMDAIDMHDAATFSMIQAGKTTAVFQLESRGMKELIVKLVPDQFDDLVALVALFRPGPLQSGMVDDFINRKHGRQQIVYPHPDVTEILEPTYGVILYQEQVMQIAQVLAGYSLGAADLLRRAMGKKKAEEMEKQREMFVNGAVARHVDAAVAAGIFDLMEKFAGYGFNKSHSAAYAVISYHTAWLKANYPAAFMAATLSADLDNTDKVVRLLADCAEMKLDVRPPNINACDYGFKPVSDDVILYGVGALKGVGANVIERIVEQREQNGPFKDLYDFCKRLDSKLLNKRLLEALIKGGAMDELGGHRAELMQNINEAIKAAGQQQQAQQAGQLDLFGGATESYVEETKKTVPPWSEEERLQAEKDILGLYLTGHPYLRFYDEFAEFSVQDLAGLDLNTPQPAIFSGLIVAMRVIKTRRGKMAAVTLDNSEERIEATFFADKYKQYVEQLSKDNIVIVSGEMSADEYTDGFQIRAHQLLSPEEVRTTYLQRLRLRLFENRLDSETLQKLNQILHIYRGGNVPIEVTFVKSGGETAQLHFGENWRIHVEQNLIYALQQLIGMKNMAFSYDVMRLKSEVLPQISKRRWSK